MTTKYDPEVADSMTRDCEGYPALAYVNEKEFWMLASIWVNHSARSLVTRDEIRKQVPRNTKPMTRCQLWEAVGGDVIDTPQRYFAGFRGMISCEVGTVTGRRCVARFELMHQLGHGLGDSGVDWLVRVCEWQCRGNSTTEYQYLAHDAMTALQAMLTMLDGYLNSKGMINYGDDQWQSEFALAILAEADPVCWVMRRYSWDRVQQWQPPGDWYHHTEKHVWGTRAWPTRYPLKDVTPTALLPHHTDFKIHPIYRCYSTPRSALKRKRGAK